jgi:hypothetical protein
MLVQATASLGMKIKSLEIPRGKIYFLFFLHVSEPPGMFTIPLF